MTKIYLARHGQDEDNATGVLNGHRDTHLTDIGRAQAKELAQKIIDHSIVFDTVYSSPLERAYITAKTITDASGMPPPEKLDGLIERDFGVMTGQYMRDIETLCGPDIIKTETITYFLSPSGGETFPMALDRAKKVLEYMLENHKNQTVLLVTHSDFGKMLYAAYYNLDWREVLTMFHFGNSELLLLSDDSAPEDTHIFSFDQHNH